VLIYIGLNVLNVIQIGDSVSYVILLMFILLGRYNLVYSRTSLVTSVVDSWRVS
jgi:hypothetical protein